MKLTNQKFAPDINFRNGDCFTAIIDGRYVTGKIALYNEMIFLCQDSCDGTGIPDKKGYKCSWKLDDLVAELRIQPKDPAEYKDWQVGDMVTTGSKSSTAKVIFRSGELVVLGRNIGTQSENIFSYSCDGLYAMGYRLIVPEAEKPILTVSMDDIAKKFGVDVSKLKIKK